MNKSLFEPSGMFIGASMGTIFGFLITNYALPENVFIGILALSSIYSLVGYILLRASVK